jgi:hypothetical protein
MALAAESVHGVTCVAPFILPADVVDQRFGALHLHFEGGNQRIFRVYDDGPVFPCTLKPTANCNSASPSPRYVHWSIARATTGTIARFDHGLRDFAHTAGCCAGVTKRLWEIGELLDVSEAWEAFGA